MTDLNAVFGQAFAEALAPLVQRIDELEWLVHDLMEAPAPNITGEDAIPAVCGAIPESEFGVEWLPCDLPFGHDEGEDGTPHNVGVVA